MILYAPNINSGGGLVLLNTVIEDEVFGKVTHLFIDKRCPFQTSFNNINIIKVKPSIISRFLAEFTLAKIAKNNPDHEIVCFGNLPPLLSHKNTTTVFLHNAYLLKSIPLPTAFKLKFRLILERLIFYYFIQNTNKLIVQSNWMKRSLKKYINKEIFIKRIIPKLPSYKSIERDKRKYDLILVTGPEQHKNSHLINQIFQNIEKKVDICILGKFTPNISNSNVCVTSYKRASREQVYQCYQNAKSLLVLSEFESFCLPIFEALHFGCKVIMKTDHYLDTDVKRINLNNEIEKLKDYL
ncbi:hypothetical protein [Halobacteriovorax sp. RT-1-4]